MNAKQNKIRRPLNRVSADDAFVAREVLRTLAAIGEPPELTQRRLFIKLIPILYSMRLRLGYTFKEITKVCNANGLKLTESTVRVYYAQFAPQMQKECEEALTEMDLIAKQIEINAKGLMSETIKSRAEMAGGFIPNDPI